MELAPLEIGSHLFFGEHTPNAFHNPVDRQGGRHHDPHFRYRFDIRYFLDLSLNAEASDRFPGMLLEEPAFRATGAKYLDFHDNLRYVNYISHRYY